MALLPNQMLQPTYITGVVNAKPSREAIKQQYIGLSLFPWEEVPERQFIHDVIYSQNNLAGIYAPDGDAIPGNDILFSQVVANVIDVKAARNLDAWSVMQLRDPGMSNLYRQGGSSTVITGIEQRLRNHINERIAWCNHVVDSQVEYLTMHALQGRVQWPPKDQVGATISNPMPHWNSKMSVDFTWPIPAGQNQNVTLLTGYGGAVSAGKVWTSYSDADPIRDLALINQYMIKTKGINMRGGRIIMSQIVLDHMAQCTNVLKWIVGVNREQPDTRRFIDEDELKTFIKTRTGYTIQTYDAQWTYDEHVVGTKPNIQRVDFLKEGKIIIIPPGTAVGNMMTAPQQAEIRGRWVYGKMGWSYDYPKPPFPIELGVNLVCWPNMTQFDHFILNCYA